MLDCVMMVCGLLTVGLGSMGVLNLVCVWDNWNRAVLDKVW